MSNKIVPTSMFVFFIIFLIILAISLEGKVRKCYVGSNGNAVASKCVSPADQFCGTLECEIWGHKSTTKTCAIESCAAGGMAWCNCSECTEDLCNGGELGTILNPPARETPKPMPMPDYVSDYQCEHVEIGPVVGMAEPPEMTRCLKPFKTCVTMQIIIGGRTGLTKRCGTCDYTLKMFKHGMSEKTLSQFTLHCEEYPAIKVD